MPLKKYYKPVNHQTQSNIRANNEYGKLFLINPEEREIWKICILATDFLLF